MPVLDFHNTWSADREGTEVETGQVQVQNAKGGEVSDVSSSTGDRRIGECDMGFQPCQMSAVLGLERLL